jgi:hypothetical protein
MDKTIAIIALVFLAVALAENSIVFYLLLHLIFGG